MAFVWAQVVMIKILKVVIITIPFITITITIITITITIITIRQHVDDLATNTRACTTRS